MLVTSLGALPGGNKTRFLVLPGNACSRLAAGQAPCGGGGIKLKSERNTLQVRKDVLSMVSFSVNVVEKLMNFLVEENLDVCGTEESYLMKEGMWNNASEI